MQPIDAPASTFSDPDRVLAQSVAADSGWQWTELGVIFDAGGTILANSLDDLGLVMRELGWFALPDAATTGIAWDQVPADAAERSAQVRSMARRLRI